MPIGATGSFMGVTGLFIGVTGFGLAVVELDEPPPPVPAGFVSLEPEFAAPDEAPL